MKLNKYLFIIGALTLTATGMTSCSDDEEYDFPGTTNNYVYHKDKSANFKVIQTPIGTVSTVDVKIPVQCTQKAKSDIAITFDVDNSLIEAYNTEHETNYVAAPEGLIVFDNQTVVIPAGEMKGTENVHITTSDNVSLLNQLSEEKTYLIPIVRKSVSGGGAIPSEEANPVIYIVMTVVHDNVHHGATEGDIKGTKVADQSGWSASVNEGTTVSSSLDRLFDGTSTTTVSIRPGTSSDVELTIDMGKEYTFDALTLYYGYIYRGSERIYGQLTSSQVISTSSDGESWTNVGIRENSDSNLFMVFYAPITARYIRILSPNVRIYGGVFNIYAL